MKKKPSLMILLGHGDHGEDDEESEDEEYTEKEEACKELLLAIKKGDEKSACLALEAFMDLHLGEHEEGEGKDELQEEQEESYAKDGTG